MEDSAKINGQAGDPPGSKKAYVKSDRKPKALPVNPDGIPAELKLLRQWLIWTFKLAKDKWTKVPRTVDGKLASTTDPATWSSFDEVLAIHLRYPDTDGIGFVFTDADPYTGVDLDDARDATTGEIREWARPLVELLDSYTEVSPSGTGLKIITRATLAGKGRKVKYGEGDVEVYCRGRYFALTGVAP